MTNPIQPAAATLVSSRPLSAALIEAMNALRGVAQRIDAWLGTRQRVVADRETLASMSDRELLDIGLDRSIVNSVAEGARMRDYPY